ncbi:MAG: hypothetical protein WBB42_13595 [Polyangiales bacterium]
MLMPRGGQPEEELKALLPATIAVRFEEMFPDIRNGRIKKRDRRRAEMLRKAEPVLQRVLHPMEVVRFATNGVRQLSWWLLTAGSMNPFANRTTLVLTDRRILLIHTDSKQRPRMFASQLPLDRIRATSGRNSYIFIRTGREQLMFHGVKRSEARRLKGLLESTASKEGGWQNLCPRCFSATDGAPLSCEKCGEEFKSPKKAALRSLFLPGLGDFYLGYRKYGMLQIMGVTLLWALFFFTVIPATMRRGFEGVVVAGPIFALLALIHIGDALLTRAKARNGLHSKDGALPTGNIGSPDPNL